MLWFLLFAVAPLAFITGYSLVKYEESIDQELGRRLVANAREIGAILNDYATGLSGEGKVLAGDKALIYYASTNDAAKARSQLKNWLKYAHHVWLWDASGQLKVALYRDAEGEVQRLESMERAGVKLNDLTPLQAKSQVLDVDVRPPAAPRQINSGVVELMVFTQLKSQTGQIVGYVQQVIRLDNSFLQALKNRLGVELFFFRPDQEKIVATQEDLAAYRTEFFQPYLKDKSSFELTLRDQPFRFAVGELKWGDTPIVMGIGASKSTAKAVLKNVNYAFFTVVAAIVVLLIILSVITSRILLRPLYDVLDGIRNLDGDREHVEIPVDNDTELGLLAASFNEMAHRTQESQKALKDKIRELEGANSQIRETQAQLVHTAKMASLGQLVAGVAHELNNPIGFIYSNMGVLREYADKLFHLVKVAEENPKDLIAEKAMAEFEYIQRDMPKLITSCEEGARRTRDIVVGLRNFSRLDEAQLKEVDIHEGLESTLQLLTGELKNRIKVHKTFGKIPKVMCYASQLNQVFMNILSNAAQAIEGNGDIYITTEMKDPSTATVKIRDSGRGMDKQTIEKIFDPFFTTKGQGSGTGLGLSISYSVIQKHGGDILVQSTPGKGTEFTILLPIKPTH